MSSRQPSAFSNQLSAINYQASGIRHQAQGTRHKDSALVPRYSGIRHQDSGPRTQHSELRTQNSEPGTQNPELGIQPEEIRRIAVVRPGQLGDVLLAMPGLRALKKGFPGAEIVLLGQRWAFDLPRRFPYIDRVLTPEEATTPSPNPAPIKGGGVTLTPSPHSGGRGRGRGDHLYDLVLQLQGDEPWAARIALALGGRVTVGFCRDEQLGAAFHLRLQMRDEEPEIWRVIRLVQALGVQPEGTQLEFPLLAEDSAELEAIAGPACSSELRPRLVLHPGARAPARRWPLERFAELTRLVYQRWKAIPFLIGGWGEEGLVEKVCETSGVPATNLAGRLSIGGLAALLSRVDLFIGNDSGPAQLAAAVAPRSLRLFGPANPHRWAPLDEDNHRIIHRNVECSPCNYWECPTDHRCLGGITVEMALTEAEALLG